MPSAASLAQDLNPQQKEAAEYRGGPLLVLAGAGTGKTRTIVHRVASLLEEGVAPSRILAVTFTNKAAEEMRTRIDNLVPGAGPRVWVHTFHAFCARILRRHAKELKLPPHFTVYDSDDQKRLIVESLKELNLGDEKNKAGLYVSVISRAKDDLLDARSYSIHAMAQGDPFRARVARVYELYERKLRAAGGLDFGDLLMRAVELLKTSEDTRSYYQKVFEQMLVDEYQDTNHAQYVMTRTLAAQHRNLCVVGDPDQAIYAFRGASIRNILEFESDFKDVKVVKLEENYRSTPNILGAADAVIQHNKRRHEKKLWTNKPAGDPVEAHELSDERHEARWTVGRIVRLADGGASLRDIAVFYRTNAQSRSFEDALRVANLPYRVIGTVRFYERKEVKDILAYMRVALNPADSVSLTRVLNVPARGIGQAAETRLKGFAASEGLSLFEALEKADQVPGLSGAGRRGARELHHILTKLADDFRTLPAAEAAHAALQRTGYWDWLERSTETDPDAANRMGNLQELMNAIQEFQEKRSVEPEDAERSAGGELSRYLEDVALRSGADGYDASQPAVTLMTVHLAKGLEFPFVFVTGLEEGLFPISAANASPEELEEERRLCYVAMTRAKERLLLTYAATRRLFGRVYTNLPSRFLVEAQLFSSGKKRPDPPAAQTEPAERVPTLRKVRKGMRVEHPEFGYGRVVELSGAGENLKVTVVFENGQAKKLLVRYAPLLPVEP